MHNSSLHQRLFQNLRHIVNLRTFIVFCGGLLGGHLKKTTQWFFFFLAAILIFVFFSIELSLCFTRLSSSIAFADRFVRRARNLKALKKKSRVEKSRSQKAWCRGSWFLFQTTVQWIEVFMQTAPYNILRIAQTTWSHQPRFLCSILILTKFSCWTFWQIHHCDIFQLFCSHITMLCTSCVFHKSLKLAFARVELLLITAGYGFELHEIYSQFSSSENLF